MIKLLRVDHRLLHGQVAIRNLWAFAEKSQSFMDIDRAYGRRNCWSTFRYFLI